MPRPGPRPYECVRRAWHSDRHQPIRGSLIQEIFRVVNEIHCPATKKNKEWQEKLPIVVLKAEEILYSKASSESEYMDLETLFERTTDAINTIIRRDESTETGDLLHPCIEAALTLGCTPRRASRSQRNSSPQRYLNTTSTTPQQEKPYNPQRQIPTSDQTPNLFHPKHGIVSKNASLSNNDSQPQPPPSPYSVYPLYYESNFPKPKTPPSNFRFFHEPTTKNCNFTPENILDEPNEGEKYDLSLRLGLHSVQAHAKGSNYSVKPQRNGELPFFCHVNELQRVDADVCLKKRKVLYGSKYTEDQEQIYKALL